MVNAVRSHLPLTTALSPLCGAVATRWSSGRRRATGARGSSGRPGSSSRSTTGAAAELALDEGESSLAVLLAVALVDVGIVAGAAVRICAVAVALDLACGLFSMSV